MAEGVRIGQQVWVPCSRLNGMRDTGVALYRSEVLEKRGYKIRVKMPDGSPSDWIGTALVHHDVGIMILNLGDWHSEATLLDPLAKSVGQFCRLLLPNDQIRQVRVRSLAELASFWKREQAAYTHVLWIGHGSEAGLALAADGVVDPNRLVDALRVRGAPKKTYVSLCCVPCNETPLRMT